MSEKQKTVLHVGCCAQTQYELHETFCGPDWREVRLNCDPDAAPDILAHITDMITITDASYEALYLPHTLEHLYPHEIPLALAELRRVLKPYGFALITVPDIQQAAEYVALDRATEPVLMTCKGPVTPLDILYGAQPVRTKGNAGTAHNFGFTATTLQTALEHAGFAGTSVHRDGKFTLWATASPEKH